MPIKRNNSLKPFSRDHHNGLLLCWKIRTGLKKDIAPLRIKKYIDWFYKTHLLPHFDSEETYVFTLLGNEHLLIKKALADHRRLKRLFETQDNLEKNLNLIEEELENHIRFEERVLFQEIQNRVSEKAMQQLSENHTEKPIKEEWKDEFWV